MNCSTVRTAVVPGSEGVEIAAEPEKTQPHEMQDRTRAAGRLIVRIIPEGVYLPAARGVTAGGREPRTAPIRISGEDRRPRRTGPAVAL